MYFLTLSEKLLLLICGLGTFQGLLLALLIYFHPKSDRSVNKFLALFIFFFSTVMLLPFVMQYVGWQNSFFIHPIPLLTGPFLYLYIRSFKETLTWNKVLPHFLIVPFFTLASYINVERLQSTVTIFLNYIKFGQGIVYFILARKTLSSYRRAVKNLFSETTQLDMKWASLLVNGFIAIVLCASVCYMFMILFPENFDTFLLATISISTPYVYLATYKGVVHHTIWQLKPDQDRSEIEQQIEKVEHAQAPNEVVEKIRPAQVTDKLNEVAERIITLMEEDKLYQETELTLQHLADKLQTPCYQVSQAINEGMNRNFYELVNGYRVEEAKRLLVNPKNRNYTILSVGFEAGFNSKTTFNTVFKKFTGLTPTDFRNRQEQKMLVA